MNAENKDTPFTRAHWQAHRIAEFINESTHTEAEAGEPALSTPEGGSGFIMLVNNRRYSVVVTEMSE